MNNLEEQIDSALTKWGAPKDTLSEIVLSYENNELGGGNCSCSSLGLNQEKINQIDLNKKASIELDEKLKTLSSLVDKNKNLICKLHGLDPNYRNDPHVEDLTKIYRTTDSLEYHINASTTSGINRIFGLYCNDKVFKSVNITIKAYGAKACRAQFTGSVNGTKDRLEYVDLTTEEQEFHFSIIDYFYEGGTVDIAFKPTTTTTIYVTYIKLEVNNGENPTFFGVWYPYNVDFIDNKYYITDCTGETAKYAILDLEQTDNLDNLTWIDTGISALSYRFYQRLTLNSETGEYERGTISYSYQGKNHKVTFYGADSNKSNLVGTLMNYDAFSPTTFEHCAMAVSRSNGANSAAFRYRFSNMSQTATSAYDCIDSSYRAIRCCGFQYLSDAKDNFEPNIFVCQLVDGTVYMNLPDSSKLDLGFGELLNAYCLSQNPYVYEVYVKYFGSIIKHTINYDETNGATLSSYNIGEYDFYFRAKDDHYFVVKDGVMKLYDKKKQIIF